MPLRGAISRALNRLHGWPHLQRAGVLLIQLAVILAAGITAFLLRFEFNIPVGNRIHVVWGLSTWILLKLLLFRCFDLHRGWWRYVSIYDVSRLFAGNLAASAVSCLVLLSVGPPAFPRSLYLLDFLLCFLLTTGVRVGTRLFYDSLKCKPDGAPGTKAVLIYGAGTAGITMLREARSNSALGLDVCGFIDDNPAKHGATIQGLKVIGGGAALVDLVRRMDVSEVLIAMPSATGPQMTAILGHCHAAGVKCRTIPAMAEIIEGHDLTNQIRDVAVEDLLGRTPVHLEESLIREKIAGRVVLVTGAAGSIGSELCRQIARFQPAGIVGFDAAESPLFGIEREMLQAFRHVPFNPEIGSIQNRARLDEVLSRYQPTVLYHAAAYKHVPLMEAHVFEAIENNVFGTYNVAVAAAEHNVEDFVMISSDKAVRPTNVMGATKRVAELLLLALQNGRTKYVAVRFGNVLGSNGSVIPIFKKQIAAGGPVTVTHPEMRRFFMTIPEACQLVLQAAVIGEGGQICVLDMGEPVKIVDLARNLILLSGLRPDDDIKIEISGMRPGEKLYEELSSTLEGTVPTAHEKIRIFTGNRMPEGEMLTWLDRLREICMKRDTGDLVMALKEIVLDYSPSAGLLKRVIAHRDHHTTAAVAGVR